VVEGPMNAPGEGADEKSVFTDDRHCFCCGSENPIGLKMGFRFEGGKILSEAVIPKAFQGFAGVVHGGILGTLLDEVMVNFHWLRGFRVVTVEYQVRLKAPCPVGRKLVLSAWPEGGPRRVLQMRSRACLEDGSVVAEASAKCMQIK
jgi:acyl-coenzyme A thioesterase PaaI-like protein